MIQEGKGVIPQSQSLGILQQEAFLGVGERQPSFQLPTRMLLVIHFPAHWPIPLFSGFYEDQCLQLGKGAEAELQEEALSHQAPPRCERKCLSGERGRPVSPLGAGRVPLGCRWNPRPAALQVSASLYCVSRRSVPPQLSSAVDRGHRCVPREGSLRCAPTGRPLLCSRRVSSLGHLDSPFSILPCSRSVPPHPGALLL